LPAASVTHVRSVCTPSAVMLTGLPICSGPPSTVHLNWSTPEPGVASLPVT
jgi:hypothetical protein